MRVAGLALVLGCGARSGLYSPGRDGGGPADAGDCRTDSDGDRVADRDEVAADTDGDAVGDLLDSDDDGDGLPTSVEAGDGDPCTPPVGSDCDDVPDYLETDADADGVADADEARAGTDPTRPDTDGDGLGDGAEALYGSDPLDASSALAPGDFFAALPAGGPPELRDLDVLAVASADVLFLVDTTGSMSGAIENLQDGLEFTIYPGLEAAIPDLQVGVAEFEDFAYLDHGQTCRPAGGFEDRGKDHAYNLLQRVTEVHEYVESAIGLLDRPMGCGGDGPESYVEALYQAATGEGVERVGKGEPFAPPVDCEDAARFGGACFRIGSLPILLLVGDNAFHNGPPDGTAHPYVDAGLTDPVPHTWPQAIEALVGIDARVIGLVADLSGAGTAIDHMRQTAEATGALGPAGEPLVFEFDYDGSGLDETVVEAVERLVREEPHDIGTRVEDTVDDGVDASRFVTSVRTVRAEPAGGVAGMDSATFYGVVPGTRVFFEVTLRNDFVARAESARHFLAVIVVLADGRPLFGGRRVLVEVPAC